MRTTTIFALAALLFVALAGASRAADNLDRTVLPIPEPKPETITTLDARDAKAPPRFEVKAPAGAPNVVIVLIDDIGFGHSSAFGGPINMPTLEKLANGGLRYNRFHTTALCSPTRVALLTGHNHHANNAGAIMELATAFPGNTGVRPRRSPRSPRSSARTATAPPRSASITRRRRGRCRCPGRTTAGRPGRASTSSTASSAARRTSGRRRSSTA